MALEEDLVRIAGLASPRGDVTAVLAAEPASGLRLYLVAFGDGDGRRWIVLDDTGHVVETRNDVRDVASIVAISELTAELAGLDDEPRLATPAYLDEAGSAVSESLRGSTGIVEAFVQDVLSGYLVDLG
jgi:hypothetical protein